MDLTSVTTLDLFAGCGGLSTGFMQAGFKVIGANDTWKVALETFKANHPKARTILGDITKETTRSKIIALFKGKTDLIVGGPPCQAYSLAGTRGPNIQHCFDTVVEPCQI